MRALSSILVVGLALSACSGGDGESDRPDAAPTTTTTTVAADDAARAACTRWRDEVLANLGEEEFASSGRFLPALDEIARDAAASTVPGLGQAASDVAAKARAVVLHGEAAGYEEAVRSLEAACASAGLGVRAGIP